MTVRNKRICYVKLYYLRHLRTLAEVFGADASGRQVVQQVADNDAVANKLRQIKHLSVVLGEFVIARQNLAAHQPVDEKLPVLLGHFDSRRHRQQHFPIAVEIRNSDLSAEISFRKHADYQDLMLAQNLCHLPQFSYICSKKTQIVEKNVNNNYCRLAKSNCSKDLSKNRYNDKRPKHFPWAFIRVGPINQSLSTTDEINQSY